MSQTPEFESSLTRLEEVVRKLEEGTVPLEESLLLFEEGVRLSRLCAGRLEEAEQRVLKLSEGAGGELTLAPMDLTAGQG